MKINKIISLGLLAVNLASVVSVVLSQNPLFSWFTLSTQCLIAFMVGISPDQDAEQEKFKVREWVFFIVYTIGILFSYKVFVWNIIPDHPVVNKFSLVCSLFAINWSVPSYLGYLLRNFLGMNKILKFEV